MSRKLWQAVKTQRKTDQFGCLERTNTDLVYFMPHDATATRLGTEDAQREYEELLQTAECTKGRLEVMGKPVPEGLRSSIEYLHNCIKDCRKKNHRQYHLCRGSWEAFSVIAFI